MLRVLLCPLNDRRRPLSPASSRAPYLRDVCPADEPLPPDRAVAAEEPDEDSADGVFEDAPAGAPEDAAGPEPLVVGVVIPR